MSQLLDKPTVPEGAPAYLQELLERFLNQTDDDLARIAFRDLVGFLTRFFGSIAATTRGGGNSSLLRKWMNGKTTTDLRDEILAAIDSLALPDEPITETFREVFLPDQWGLSYRHTEWMRGRWLLPQDEDWRQPATEMLAGWLQASQPFFRQCQHRYEELGSKVELATRFQGDWVRTGFPMRSRDLRVRPLKLDGADATYRPRQIVPVDTSQLSALVNEISRRQEQSVRRAPKPAPKPELGFEMLEVRSDTNPFGAPCYRGVLKISEKNGLPVQGRIHTAFEGLKLAQRQFVGQDVCIPYSLDPGLRQDLVENQLMVVVVDDHSFRLPLKELCPSSEIAQAPWKKAALAVASPALLALAYITALHWHTVSEIESWVGSELGVLQSPNLSLLELKAIPAAQVCAFCILLAAVVAPVLATKLFQRVVGSTRSLVGVFFPAALLLPTAGLLILRSLGGFDTRLTYFPAFQSLDFAWFFPWFAAFNVGASLYLFCSEERLLDRWLAPEVRFLLPFALSSLFLLVVGVLAF